MTLIDLESGLFVRVAELESDAEIVVRETEDLQNWLQELQNPARRRLLARFMVLNLAFLADVVGELYTLTNKVALEVKQKQSVGTAPAHIQLQPPAREHRQKASEIARRLKPVRDSIAHPYRIGTRRQDNSIDLWPLTVFEHVTRDEDTLRADLKVLRRGLGEIRTWFNEGWRLGIR